MTNFSFYFILLCSFSFILCPFHKIPFLIFLCLLFSFLALSLVRLSFSLSFAWTFPFLSVAFLSSNFVYLFSSFLWIILISMQWHLITHSSRIRGEMKLTRWGDERWGEMRWEGERFAKILYLYYFMKVTWALIRLWSFDAHSAQYNIVGKQRQYSIWL